MPVLKIKKDGSWTEVWGGSIETDRTLTQEGMAADAKAVGDALDGVAKVFITALEDMAGMWGVDHTFTEIKAAYDAGYLCFLYDYGDVVPLIRCNDTEIVFSGTERYSCRVTVRVTSGNNVSVDYEDYISAVYDEMPDSYYVSSDISMQSSQLAGSYCLRNTRLSSSGIAPSSNGEICWTYE